MTININKSQGTLSFSPLVNTIDNMSDRDKQLLRDAIIAELDAVNKYELFANNTNNEDLKKIFLDVAKEEKVHAAEFTSLLRDIDNEETPAVIEGFKEVETKLNE